MHHPYFRLGFRLFWTLSLAQSAWLHAQDSSATPVPVPVTAPPPGRFSPTGLLILGVLGLAWYWMWKKQKGLTQDVGREPENDAKDARSSSTSTDGKAGEEP